MKNSFNGTVIPFLAIGVEYIQQCVKWRQTKECKSDGPRWPKKDKSCDTPIEVGWSGYCECSDGKIAMEKGCISGRYRTCNDACSLLEGR